VEEKLKTSMKGKKINLHDEFGEGEKLNLREKKEGTLSRLNLPMDCMKQSNASNVYLFLYYRSELQANSSIGVN